MGCSKLLVAELIRRHAALGKECAVEGALIAVTAEIGDLGYRIGRILQQRACTVNAQRVDVLPEIDVQLLGKNVAQVDAADAKCMGGALQGERLGEVLGNVVQHLESQRGMGIAPAGGHRQTGEQVG